MQLLLREGGLENLYKVCYMTLQTDIQNPLPEEGEIL